MTTDAASAARERITTVLGGDFCTYSIRLGRKLGGINNAVLLQYLIRWCARSTDGWCYRTRDQIEDDTLLTLRMQRTAKDELIAMGLIEREMRGQPAQNYYRVDYEALDRLLADENADRPLETDVQNDRPSRAETTPQLCRNDTPSRDETAQPYIGVTKEKTKEKQILPDSGESGRKRHSYTPEFEAFWALYPRGHGSKFESFKQWKLLTVEERADAIAGIAAWVNSARWHENGGKYIVDCERYLKRRYWENPPQPMGDGRTTRSGRVVDMERLPNNSALRARLTGKAVIN